MSKNLDWFLWRMFTTTIIFVLSYIAFESIFFQNTHFNIGFLQRIGEGLYEYTDRFKNDKEMLGYLALGYGFIFYLSVWFIIRIFYITFQMAFDETREGNFTRIYHWIKNKRRKGRKELGQGQ